MVSAWGCELRMVMAQVATDEKSNEITAVPKLLAMLSLKGTIVTTDALNCQRAIAQQIIDQGGDYALALKASQSSMPTAGASKNASQRSRRISQGSFGRFHSSNAFKSPEIAAAKNAECPGLLMSGSALPPNEKRGVVNRMG